MISMYCLQSLLRGLRMIRLYLTITLIIFAISCDVQVVSSLGPTEFACLKEGNCPLDAGTTAMTFDASPDVFSLDADVGPIDTGFDGSLDAALDAQLDSGFMDAELDSGFMDAQLDSGPLDAGHDGGGDAAFGAGPPGPPGMPPFATGQPTDEQPL